MALAAPIEEVASANKKKLGAKGGPEERKWRNSSISGMLLHNGGIRMGRPGRAATKLS